jgi:carboxyl-terminal processing protease
MADNQPKIYNYIHIIGAFLVVFIAGFLFGNQVTYIDSQTRTDNTIDSLFSPLFQAYFLIQENYHEEIEDEVLVNGAIDGMVAILGDRYSTYLTPEVNQHFTDSLSGDMEGIGATIRTNDDDLVEVVNTLPNTPAEEAGVRVGDIFYAVDGMDVLGMSQEELLPLVRGRAGTTVLITFQRGEDLIDLEITRRRFEIPTIEFEAVADDRIGYVRILDFSTRTRARLDDALDSLNINNMDGLILDLRGNPGGLLTSTVEVISAFVPEGVILYEVFGDNTEQTFEADGSFYGVDVPIVVLVDQGSASASEVLAGTLQDYELATVMGDVTFGKGTVQVLHQLMNGGGLRVTIAKWLTPLRHSISEVGITPDILVPLPEDFDFDRDGDIQLEAAIDYIAELTAESVGAD